MCKNYTKNHACFCAKFTQKIDVIFVKVHVVCGVLLRYNESAVRIALQINPNYKKGRKGANDNV